MTHTHKRQAQHTVDISLPVCCDNGHVHINRTLTDIIAVGIALAITTSMLT